jgi:hypothetical protein
LTFFGINMIRNPYRSPFRVLSSPFVFTFGSQFGVRCSLFEPEHEPSTEHLEA